MGLEKFDLGELLMRNAKLGFAVVLVICGSVFASGQMAAPPPAKTPGDALNAILSIAEGEFTGAADAMPEDKFSFGLWTYVVLSRIRR